MKLAMPLTNAIAIDSRPQLAIMRAIHRRAPNLSKARLLGISNMKYPTKKSPAPKPYELAVRWRSWVIPVAKLIFTRLRNDARYAANNRGRIRQNAFETTWDSTSMLSPSFFESQRSEE